MAMADCEYLTTTKQQLLDALEKTGDKPEDLVCFYQPIILTEDFENWGVVLGDMVACSFDELPERLYDAMWGRVEGEPCIAFSPRYVYVKVQHDGAEWFEPVPRHPEYVRAPIPCLGG